MPGRQSRPAQPERAVQGYICEGRTPAALPAVPPPPPPIPQKSIGPVYLDTVQAAEWMNLSRKTLD
jgi:hypothetical protein